MSTDPSVMRRRGTTGSTPISFPNNLPTFHEASYNPLPTSPTHVKRASSFHGSFLSEKKCWSGSDEDVKTDVLYPRFNASQDDHVDIAAFEKMVQDHTRKLSAGTIKLSRTPSKQNQLYGQSKYGDLTPLGVRFKIYSSQKNSTISARLEQLLTEEGQKALESVVTSKGWWVDVLSPSTEEMRVLSKVSNTCREFYSYSF